MIGTVLRSARPADHRFRSARQSIFLFRRDLNLAVAIHALEVKHQLQPLAEPNLMVINNTQARFVAAENFRFPSFRAEGYQSISIVFKEYGIKLGFLPVVTHLAAPYAYRSRPRSAPWTTRVL